MSLLSPIYLFGLLGLLVPVIIHLWSRNATITVAFGSLRFLKETETRTVKNILPSQLVLLLLRCLMLSVLVLLLSEAFIKKSPERTDRVYLIDRQFEGTPFLRAFKDTLSENTKAFWLTRDFPPVYDSKPTETADYFNLLSDPPKIDASAWMVISSLKTFDFSGVRKEFPVPYLWLKMPVNPVLSDLLAYEKGDETLKVVEQYDEWSTKVALEPAVSAPVIEIDYFLKVDEEYKELGQIMKAVLSTIQELSPLTLKESNDQDADWVFWLSNEQAPTRLNLIVPENGMLGVWREVTPGYYSVAGKIEQRKALEADLPVLLLNAMAKNAIDENEGLLTVDASMFEYSQVSIGGSVQQASLDAILWIGLLLLFVAERWFSHKTAGI